MNRELLIREARILDPSDGYDAVGFLGIRDGRIVYRDTQPPHESFAEVLEARGKWLMPGAVDLCARLREPGATHKATMKSESPVALRSGITALCMPPDTLPVVDTPALVNRINRIAKAARGAHVYVLGALTQGLLGQALAEMSALKQAGCVGVSNANVPLASTLMARRALEYASSLDLTVHVQALDAALAHDGCAHEGAVATRLGLPGIPVAAETLAIRQWLSLVEDTGARVHFCRIASQRAVGLLESAKARKLPVTADVAAHHLFLTEADLEGFNADCHVIPPLRAESDRLALRDGLASGIIDAVCSDHQPHETDAKVNPFPLTEPGISALETLLPLVFTLVGEGLLSPLAAAERLSMAPAAILGIQAGTLALQAPADWVLVDPRREWRLRRADLQSAGRNTPFDGWSLTGGAVEVGRAGR